MTNKRQRYLRQCSIVLSLALYLFTALLSGAQASASSQSTLGGLLLPTSIQRISMMQRASWQGLEIELERLHSLEPLDKVLEQLASALPPMTPLWSEQGMTQATWLDEQRSYILLLWLSEKKETEGLLSSLGLKPSGSDAANDQALLASVSKWLPHSAVKLFHFLDSTNDSPVLVALFSLNMTPPMLAQHLQAYARQTGWIQQAQSLSFVRGEAHLLFESNVVNGYTTVFIYYTAQDSL